MSFEKIALCVTLYTLAWAFTSVLMSRTHKQDLGSYIVWDTESFVFAGFFWPFLLPPTLVRVAVEYWTHK